MASGFEVLGIGFDWDNCVANQKFIRLAVKIAEQKKVDQDKLKGKDYNAQELKTLASGLLLDQELLQGEPPKSIKVLEATTEVLSRSEVIELLKLCNPDLKNYVLAKVQESGAKKVVCLLASNRQHADVEDLNIFIKGYNCFMYHKGFFTDFLQPELRELGVEVEVKDFLLGDIARDRAHGATLSNYLERKGLKDEFDDSLNDDSKRGLYMAQAHYLATEAGPDKKVGYMVVDDAEGIILEPSNRFFKGNPDKLPKTVTVSMHLYNGSTTPAQLGDEVVGTGDPIAKSTDSEFNRQVAQMLRKRYFSAKDLAAMETATSSRSSSSAAGFSGGLQPTGGLYGGWSGFAPPVPTSTHARQDAEWGGPILPMPDFWGAADGFHASGGLGRTTTIMTSWTQPGSAAPQADGAVSASSVADSGVPRGAAAMPFAANASNNPESTKKRKRTEEERPEGSSKESRR